MIKLLSNPIESSNFTVNCDKNSSFNYDITKAKIRI